MRQLHKQTITITADPASQLNGRWSGESDLLLHALLRADVRSRMQRRPPAQPQC